MTVLLETYIDLEGNYIEVYSSPTGHISHLCKGFYHRLDGPAWIYPALNEERWFLHGRPHNPNGPAVLKKDDFGNIINKEYWDDGQYIGYIIHFLKFKKYLEDDIIKLFLHPEAALKRPQEFIKTALLKIGWSEDRVEETVQMVELSKTIAEK